MNHTKLLNYLIQKHGLKSYLEIGVQNPANNFDKIKVLNKYGIDPNVDYTNVSKCTSDDWFHNIFYVEFKTGLAVKYDLIFIDGDHTADQVERDFNNSLKCLNDGGFIVLHDTCPDEEQYAIVPRTTKKWFGDVYKWAMLAQYNYDGIDFVTLNMDCGCMVVWKDLSKKKDAGFADQFIGFDCLVIPNMWSYYCKNKNRNMRIIEPSELDKYLPKVKEAAT